jgi:hypothetical protein
MARSPQPPHSPLATMLRLSPDAPATVVLPYAPTLPPWLPRPPAAAPRSGGATLSRTPATPPETHPPHQFTPHRQTCGGPLASQPAESEAVNQCTHLPGATSISRRRWAGLAPTRSERRRTHDRPQSAATQRIEHVSEARCCRHPAALRLPNEGARLPAGRRGQMTNSTCLSAGRAPSLRRVRPMTR